MSAVTPARRPNEAEKNHIRNTVSSIKYVQDSYFQALQSNPQLKQKDYIEFIERNLTFDCFLKGQSICHVGDAAKSMFIIIEGKAGVAVPVPESEASEREEKAKALVEKTRNQLEKNGENVMIALKKHHQSCLEKLPKSTHVFLEEMMPKSNEESEISRGFQDLLPLAKYEEMGYNCDDLLLLGIGKTEMYYSKGAFKFRKVAEKKAGEIVGEQALANDQPRNATVYALENIHLASLPKALFERIFKSKIEDEKTRMRFFKSIFTNISQKTISKCINYFHSRTLIMNQVLFKAGDPIMEVFLIYSGEIDIIKTVHYEAGYGEFQDPLLPKFSARSKMKSRSQNVKMSRLVSGEFIGVEDLLLGGSQGKMSCTAVGAKASSTILCLSLVDFYKMEQSSEKVVSDVIKKRARLKMERFQAAGEVGAMPLVGLNQMAYDIHAVDCSVPSSFKTRAEKEAEAKAVMKNMDLKLVESHPSQKTILQEADQIWSPMKQKKSQRKLLVQRSSLGNIQPLRKTVNEPKKPEDGGSHFSPIQIEVPKDKETKPLAENNGELKEIKSPKRPLNYLSASKSSSSLFSPIISPRFTPKIACPEFEPLAKVPSLNIISSLRNIEPSTNLPKSPQCRTFKDLLMSNQQFFATKKTLATHGKNSSAIIEKKDLVLNVRTPGNFTPKKHQVIRARNTRTASWVQSKKEETPKKELKLNEGVPSKFGMLPSPTKKHSESVFSASSRVFSSGRSPKSPPPLSLAQDALPFPLSSPLFTMKENNQKALVDLTGKYLLGKYFKSKN